jgi:hypothetical protein
MAFSSWRLPKLNFGKLSKSRQIGIRRDFGRTVLARPRSLPAYYSDRLLGDHHSIGGGGGQEAPAGA